jgi:hypothetical protein
MSHRMRLNEDGCILFLDGREADGQLFDFAGGEDD